MNMRITDNGAQASQTSSLAARLSYKLTLLINSCFNFGNKV